MRAEVMRVRSATYVEASYLEGGNRLHALLGHVLPNAYRSVLVLAVLQFGTSILIIASLAFLGYGDPPPRLGLGGTPGRLGQNLRHCPMARVRPPLWSSWSPSCR